MQGVKKIPLGQEKTVSLVKDVFISAAERDIYTGDSIIINVVNKNGVSTETFQLRKD